MHFAIWVCVCEWGGGDVEFPAFPINNYIVEQSFMYLWMH